MSVAGSVFALAAGDGLVAGILTGAYGVFSAGVGLKAFAKGDTPVVEGRGFGGITRTGIRTPLIAAVEPRTGLRHRDGP
ncbi:hypothetical protein AB0E10_37845 [Streptomyces sp. NPDC048045]|uniref:hypothetical protein n=1 Tax=Streptomyces sp. NPDC048045 TaxID=3154710 RepID=UPI0034345C7A